MFTAEQLEYACAGVPFPARRWQLVAWADWNCASTELREAFRHLPDQLYTGTDQLLGLFEAIRRREAQAREDGAAPRHLLDV